MRKRQGPALLINLLLALLLLTQSGCTKSPQAADYDQLALSWDAVVYQQLGMDKKAISMLDPEYLHIVQISPTLTLFICGPAVLNRLAGGKQHIIWENKGHYTIYILGGTFPDGTHYVSQAALGHEMFHYLVEHLGWHKTDPDRMWVIPHKADEMWGTSEK